MPSGNKRRLRHSSTVLSVWILFTYVTVAGAVKVSVVADSIQVVQGGSVLLPCYFHTTAPLNRLNIIWTVVPAADPNHPQQVLAYEQGEVVESVSRYTGRVSFAFSPTQSATIVLNDTRSSDSGTYQCSVMNPPDTTMPNIGVIQLTVFVPPSNPRCSSEGSGDEGGTLQFSCTVDEGTPIPTFAWEKIPPTTQPLVTSYEDDYHILLTFHNLTTEASGLYCCTVSNMLGSVSCSLELRVHVAPRSSTSLVVGITLMLIMGLVLLTLFALVLWLHHHSRNKWEEDDSYNEIRLDNLSFGRLIVSKSPPGDISISSPTTQPLWIFTSSTPNTTYAHRERRLQPGTASRVMLPGGLREPTLAHQGRQISNSLSEHHTSSSGSEEEKQPLPSPSQTPTGFLV
ncbi:immunoglobulin superfamily member 11-like [Heteronotia binoei]|uniref:immunoglobulin superfamily member 11-like n=1 Tax=Heteronotia binoei TaxID=13085 RepID=UPI00292CF92E|nr:immunoglobulin superfamily member 11-like [Heteronotia binoei]